MRNWIIKKLLSRGEGSLGYTAEVLAKDYMLSKKLLYNVNNRSEILNQAHLHRINLSNWTKLHDPISEKNNKITEDVKIFDLMNKINVPVNKIYQKNNIELDYAVYMFLVMFYESEGFRQGLLNSTRKNNTLVIDLIYDKAYKFAREGLNLGRKDFSVVCLNFIDHSNTFGVSSL
jgi:hypothetical protein